MMQRHGRRGRWWGWRVGREALDAHQWHRRCKTQKGQWTPACSSEPHHHGRTCAVRSTAAMLIGAPTAGEARSQPRSIASLRVPRLQYCSRGREGENQGSEGRWRARHPGWLMHCGQTDTGVSTHPAGHWHPPPIISPPPPAKSAETACRWASLGAAGRSVGCSGKARHRQAASEAAGTARPAFAVSMRVAGSSTQRAPLCARRTTGS